MSDKRKPLPQKDVTVLLRECAAEHGGISALGRKLGLKSNHLQYVISKRQFIGPALVGRCYMALGDTAITRELAKACRKDGAS